MRSQWRRFHPVKPTETAARNSLSPRLGCFWFDAASSLGIVFVVFQVAEASILWLEEIGMLDPELNPGASSAMSNGAVK
jgi:hypothetical protein